MKVTTRTLLQGLVDLVYPGVCLSCRRKLYEDDRGLCSRCWGRLIPTELQNCKGLLSHRKGLNRVMTGWFFDDILQTLVHDLKYKEKRWVAEELAERLWVMFGVAVRKLKLEAVVPVPLHSVRHRERGYNQSDLLGRPLAAALGLAYVPGILKRNRNTRSQTALTVQDRLRNVEGAFRVKDLGDLERILLVDDVVTSGATLSSCAMSLKEAGTRYVAALTVGTPFIEN